jgi:hypothetical protein
MNHHHHPLLRAWPLLGLAALLLSPLAQADRVDAPQLPAYQQECGACHLAYPPGLLPAASWQHLMANLPRHFGSDASLDKAPHQQISGWLQANAGSFKKVARDPSPPPQDRISLAPWFVRKHHEIAASTWQRKAIGSAANCVACHAQAAEGDFSEHGVRVPK